MHESKYEFCRTAREAIGDGKTDAYVPEPEDLIFYDWVDSNHKNSE